MKMFLSSEILVGSTAMLRRTKSFADAKVILDDGTVHKIHKLLLARDSLFFNKLFTHEQGKDYHLQMVAKAEFAQVLDWIYEVCWFDPSVTTILLSPGLIFPQIYYHSLLYKQSFSWKKVNQKLRPWWISPQTYSCIYNYCLNDRC